MWEDCRIRQALGLLWECSVQTVRYIVLRHIIRKSEQETFVSGIPNPVQTITSDSAQQSNLAKNLNGFLALTNPLARQMICRTTGRVHMHSPASSPTQSQLFAWPYYEFEDSILEPIRCRNVLCGHLCTDGLQAFLNRWDRSIWGRIPPSEAVSSGVLPVPCLLHPDTFSGVYFITICHTKGFSCCIFQANFRNLFSPSDIDS